LSVYPVASAASKGCGVVPYRLPPEQFLAAAGPGPQDARFSRIGVETVAQRSGATKEKGLIVPSCPLWFSFYSCACY